jgi:hypothetical protein
MNGVNGDRHAQPSHTVLLTGIDAPPREVMVPAASSLDYQMYQDHLERQGLFNMQLKVWSSPAYRPGPSLEREENELPREW